MRKIVNSQIKLIPIDKNKKVEDWIRRTPDSRLLNETNYKLIRRPLIPVPSLILYFVINSSVLISPCEDTLLVLLYSLGAIV